jgi:fatty-acyl-CoA synthase
MNLSLLLEMVADCDPARAIIGPRTSGMSADDLLQGARRSAQLFTARGASKVALVDVNSDAVPVALFGSALAGVPFAPINYRLPDNQLRSLLQRLAPVVAVVGNDVGERVLGIDGVEVLTRDDFLRLTGDGPTAPQPGDVDGDDVAVVLFTSGTTGEPKAAWLRHRHLTSYVLSTVECMGAGADDAQLVSVPPYHIAGISSVLSCVYAGRRLVYLTNFEPDAWLDTVITERITHAMVVPTMLTRLLDRLAARRLALPSLRHISYGGGRMPTDVIERALRVLPDVDFVNAYGLTETSSTISILGPDDHRDSFASSQPSVRKRLSSVGKPLPTVEIDVRGPGGEILPSGDRGEIYVRGDQIAGEYEGRSASGDGWFATNDGGYIDDDGFLYLEGRLDDVIVRGAENLSPAEIEDVLRAHPVVTDVAVIGIPDIDWGEAVAAVVVIEEGVGVSAVELQQWVRARLRSTKTPQLIEFRKELPYTDTGKLLRRVLRAEIASSQAGVGAREIRRTASARSVAVPRGTGRTR